MDPLSMESFKKSGGNKAEKNAAAPAKPAAPPRKLTSRLWMAHDFPLSLHELQPVLDIIGHANKHIQKVSG